MCVFLGKEMVVKVLDVRGGRGQWWFRQQGAEQSEMLLTVYSPANAPIGQYQLVVLMTSLDGHILDQTPPQSFHLLFNPWCKGQPLDTHTQSHLGKFLGTPSRVFVFPSLSSCGFIRNKAELNARVYVFVITCLRASQVMLFMSLMRSSCRSTS